MMQAKHIISKSLAAFVGTIDNSKDYLRQIEYTKYNLNWLNAFDSIVYSLNGSKNFINEFIADISSIVKPQVEILFSDNIGPVFGAMDNDQKIFEYIKTRRDIDYIWKFSNDTIADSTILDIEIDDDYDFFYINNIGYAAFANKSKQELLTNIISQEYFYPQTNYYIIKNKNIEWYPSKSLILSLQAQYQTIINDHPEYNPWDAIQGCDCETMLSQTIKNNNFKSKHLLNENDTKKIIDLVYDHKIVDGSHKNIMYTNVGNLCHYHVVNHPVAAI